MWVPLLMLLGAIYLWFYNDRRKYAGMPPGPLRLPLLGNLLQILIESRIPSLALEKLARKHGDVMYIRIGMFDVVIISSHEAATEFFTSNNWNNKPSLMHMESRNQNGNYGVILSNGTVWQNLRRFTLRTLRDYGFGKSASMDVVLNDEVDKFLAHFQEQIDSSPEGIVLFEDTFDLAVVNGLWRLVSGKSYELTDEKMQTFLRLSKEYMESGNLGDLTLAYPKLGKWFPKLTPFDKQEKCMAKLKAFLMQIVEEHRARGTYSEDPTCLIDVFLQKIEEGKEEEFTDTQLTYVLLDLFQAGSETTSKTIAFVMLYMIVYPQVQDKLGKEMDKIIGADEPITIGMRGRLPYAHAIILETMRLGNIIPMINPRECLSDTTLRGHLIKKNTPVICNLQAVHLQDSNWGPDPHSFRPERFLGKDGQVDSKIAEKLMPFSGGKRICLGQSLAEASAFVYIVSVLRKFKLEKVEGENEPSTVPKLGMTLGPQPFYAKIVEKRKK